MDNSNRNDRGSADTSVLGRIIEWDEDLTRQLALCSRADSPWGHLRPCMRLLEYSCHGVPWFVGVAALLLMSHQFETQQKLINLFSSEYDTCTYFAYTFYGIEAKSACAHSPRCSCSFS